MPRKVRQLRAEIRKEGFVLAPKRGKGSHTAWQHPDVPGTVIISGKDGDDAQHWQEEDVQAAIEKARQARKQKGAE